jgi:hypothetical protein
MTCVTKPVIVIDQHDEIVSPLQTSDPVHAVAAQVFYTDPSLSETPSSNLNE